MGIKIFCVTFLLLMLNVALLFAQVTSWCPDPDVPCPIDDWIIVLAGGAFLFAVLNLYRKQKKLIQTNKIK
jgi:hypothetical protein